MRAAAPHPLAITGEVANNPYADLAAVVEPDLHRIVAATQLAARRPLHGHGEAAREALITVLATEGLDTSGAGAVAVREDNQLTVTLVPGVGTDRRIAETASVRVLAAVRAFDPHVSIIDVTLAAEAETTPAG